MYLQKESNDFTLSKDWTIRKFLVTMNESNDCTADGVKSVKKLHLEGPFSRKSVILTDNRLPLLNACEAGLQSDLNVRMRASAKQETSQSSGSAERGNHSDVKLNLSLNDSDEAFASSSAELIGYDRFHRLISY
jgi:hypothetical protein